MKKGNLTNKESRRVFKKVMKARKRRKTYVRMKNIERNKPKKKPVRTFPLEHPPKNIFNHVPPTKKLSWWKRLWSFIKVALHV